jgi:hypothetical protein
VRVRRSKNGRRAHIRHLYSDPRQRVAERREFERKYGAAGGRSGRGGDYIYGAVVGKVARERRAARARARRR